MSQLPQLVSNKLDDVMGRAPRTQRRRFGRGEVLVPPQPLPVQPLVECLESLRSSWRKEGSMAALWQDWPQLAGSPLSDHCRPLNLIRGVLTVGARHPQWRQALQYSKPQLLAAVRSAGHPVRDLRIQQYHPSSSSALETEESVWARHPSRIDIHGMSSCPCCKSPAPAGEMALWGHCGFCRRLQLSERTRSLPTEQSYSTVRNAQDAGSSKSE